MNTTALHYHYAAITIAGIDHTQNQDRVMIEGNLLERGALSGTSEGTFLAVVCDGVEGVAHGEKAADLAASSLRSSCGVCHSPFSLCRAVYQANGAVLNAGEPQSNKLSCATTLAVLYLDEKSYCLFNAGDTRIYRYDAEGLSLLSTDHVYITAPTPKEKGALAVSDRSNAKPSTSNCPDISAHASVNVNSASQQTSCITQCLGLPAKDLALSVVGNTNLRIEEGLFLLCSDGLYRHLPEGEILAALNSDTSLTDTCLHLAAAAKSNGSTDDLSVVLVRVDASVRTCPLAERRSKNTDGAHE